MRRIADSGVRFPTFTAAVPTHAVESANGCNATSNNMACIEGSAGFPASPGSCSETKVSEVLNAQGWNTYAIGKCI